MANEIKHGPMAQVKATRRSKVAINKNLAGATHHDEFLAFSRIEAIHLATWLCPKRQLVTALRFAGQPAIDMDRIYSKEG